MDHSLNILKRMMRTKRKSLASLSTSQLHNDLTIGESLSEVQQRYVANQI